MLSITCKSIRNRLSIGTVVALLLSLSFSALFASDDAANNSASAPQSVSKSQAMFNAIPMSAKSDPDVLDDFIRQFPDSDEARVAFGLRYVLLSKDNYITPNKRIEAYNKFIDRYPGKRQTQIAMSELYNFYREKNTVPGYYDYIQRYPDTIQAIVAFHHIEQLMFEFAKRCNTEEDYDAFIESFPDAPQVDSALENAKQILLEKERKKYNDFLKANPAATRDNKLGFASRVISKWEQSVEELRREVKRDPNIVLQTSFQLRVWKLDRQADVLQKVYDEVNEGRIQATRNAAHISDILNEIKDTINNNHKELLKKLDDETDRICKKLEELHQDNQKIIGTLRIGFNQLHQDLVAIHQDLVDIKQTLDDIDSHLRDISNSLSKFATTAATGGTSLLLDFAKDCIHEGTKIAVALINRHNVKSDDIFKDISCAAVYGYEDCQDVWESSEAEVECETAKSYLQKSPIDSTIARYIGALAGAATSKFVPLVGEDMALFVGKVTKTGVEHYGMPVAKKVFVKTVEAKEFQWVFVKESAKEAWNENKEIIIEELPQILNEEEDNLLNAGAKLAKKFEIEEKWYAPVIEAVKERDVNKMVIPWAENIGVSQNVIDFYERFLSFSSELQ